MEHHRKVAYAHTQQFGSVRHRGTLPVEAINIEEDDLLYLGLRRYIYSKQLVEELLRFQDSLRMRKTYLAEMAYGR